jgi:DNA adenine methylase
VRGGGGEEVGVREQATVARPALPAPFPWFGGKSRAASLIWERFGDVPNYVEPFAGSLAVLLQRPTAPRTETVNDADAYLANFWRALQTDPDAVAAHAAWPVNEADLHARHKWLVAQADFRERMMADPDYFDARIAGWWVWGQCSWIGTGWCAAWQRRAGHPPEQLPHLGGAGRGIHRKLPHLGDAGRGDTVEYLRALAVRLRNVRVACGDWSRVTGDSVTWRHGTTGVLLDPPYAEGEMSYSAGGVGVSLAVREWATEMGERRDMRIALCGLDGEHEMPSDWNCVAWTARGGYGSQSAQGNDNRKRERIWFSPHCLAGRQRSLFEVSA